ncbi:MAG: T9SS type A sorting domain-containing protein [Bacteroidia bacterium]
MKKIYIILLTIYCLVSPDKVNAQWERVISFTGGLTTCMTKDSSTIYACIYKFGLVKSSDEGDHWSLINDSINFSNYGAFGYPSISAEGNKILYFDNTNQVILSSDSGITWQNIAVPGPFGSTDAKIFKGKLIACDGHKVYISGDDGITWITDSLGFGNFKIEITDNKVFLVAKNGSALYCSVDTGNTWVSLGATGFLGYNSFLAQGDTLAILSPFGTHLIVSTDFGANWIPKTCPWVTSLTNSYLYFDNDTLCLLHNDSIFKSHGLGSPWKFHLYKAGLMATSILKIGNEFLIGSRNHAFLKYSPLNNSIVKKAKDIHANVIDLIKVKGDTIMLTSGFLYCVSLNNGLTWDYSIPLNRHFYTLSFLNYDTGAVYVCYEKKVVKSLDWGLTWIPFDTVPDIIRNMICYNGNEYYATNYGIYKGSSLGGGVSNYGIFSSYINGLAGCNNKLFATTMKDVCMTNSSGPLWSSTTNGLPNPKKFYYATANDTAVFIAGPKGVYRCYGSDTTWTYTGLYNKNVRELTCFRNDAFAISFSKGVAILRNAPGSKWDPINFGLDSKIPKHIAVGDSFMFCGGGFPGLYKRLRDQVITPTGINENNSVDDFYFSISPNPASDIMQITGNVQSGNAKLNLVDITGRICFTETVSSKGNFSFNINANNLADGIYFLNMFDGNKKYSGKVLIQH